MHPGDVGEKGVEWDCRSLVNRITLNDSITRRPGTSDVVFKKKDS